MATVALLTPLWYAGYRAAVGDAAQGDPGWTAGLTVLALLAAVTVATYLPGGRTAATACAARPGGGIAPCAATPLFSVLLAAVVLNGAATTPVAAVFALVLILLALAQRLLLLPGNCPGQLPPADLAPATGGRQTGLGVRRRAARPPDPNPVALSTPCDRTGAPPR